MAKKKKSEIKYTLAKALLGGIAFIIMLGGIALVILPEAPGDAFYGLFNILMGCGLIYALLMWAKETSR